ncbi:ElyC/SanA/YdcF family protein [Verrucomicrobiales bacterium BCK34]|nr:ElyC/SanA/YdcF family protein [Verrucomicrobiales bacterium BCK34]
MPRKRKRSIFFWLVTLPLLLLVAFVVVCNLWIVGSTRERVFATVTEVTAAPVGLVLGTSKKVSPDTLNLHFQNRVKAAAELIKSGRVETLLVSGYRDSQYYDETRDMIKGLTEMGVPEASIIADDKGARTLDSLSRAKSVFGFEDVVIVSDDFHVNRALFIADHVGVKAVALESAEVDRMDSRSVRIRECFARVKAVIDLYFVRPEAQRKELVDSKAG